MFIILSPDITLLIPYECKFCTCTTDHFIEFVAYNSRYHIISYNVICEDCFYTRRVREQTKQITSVKGWIEMVENVSDAVRNN